MQFLFYEISQTKIFSEVIFWAAVCTYRLLKNLNKESVWETKKAAVSNLMQEEVDI